VTAACEQPQSPCARDEVRSLPFPENPPAKAKGDSRARRCAPDKRPHLSIFRTSNPCKTLKISYAASGLALAAAAGAVGVWSASAATQPASSSSPPVPVVVHLAARAVSPPLTASGQASAGQQTAVLDAFTAVSAGRARPALVGIGKGGGHHRGRKVRLTPKQIARAMLRSFRWSTSQFPYLNLLWSRESSWNVYASNPYSGAYGIPQAVPGSKMASAGPNWERNAKTQIRWGLRYIKDRYGSPRAAWDHELATGWY
jgi:hypothetical protein